LKGFARAIEKIGLKSIEFHSKRGDFEKWTENSLHDNALTKELKNANLVKLRGEQLRKMLVKIVRGRLDFLQAEI
jgi:hypothetical protein